MFSLQKPWSLLFSCFLVTSHSLSPSLQSTKVCLLFVLSFRNISWNFFFFFLFFQTSPLTLERFNEFIDYRWCESPSIEGEVVGFNKGVEVEKSMMDLVGGWRKYDGKEEMVGFVLRKSMFFSRFFLLEEFEFFFFSKDWSIFFSKKTGPKTLERVWTKRVEWGFSFFFRQDKSWKKMVGRNWDEIGWKIHPVEMVWWCKWEFGEKCVEF